jgi:hypothetical protein
MNVNTLRKTAASLALGTIVLGGPLGIFCLLKREQKNIAQQAASTLRRASEAQLKQRFIRAYRNAEAEVAIKDGILLSSNWDAIPETQFLKEDLAARALLHARLSRLYEEEGLSDQAKQEVSKSDSYFRLLFPQMTNATSNVAGLLEHDSVKRESQRKSDVRRKTNDG